MNLRRIIAAALSLTFVAGATTNMNNYAPINSIMVSAQGETAVTTTTATTTKVVTTTTTAATTTKAAVTTTKTATTTTAKATTSKAATTKAAVTSTTATVTTTAKPVTSVTTTSTTTPVANDIIYGDVNNDGRIDAIDASTILAHYALISTNKKGILTEAQIKSADINNDGVVNAVDASTVLAIYAANSVKAVKPSVQNNPIHDFSMDYNIDLTSPTWEYCEEDPETKEIVYYCDKFDGDYKMDEFFPNEKELKEKFEQDKLQDKFGNLSDYRCVATIVLNPKKDENIVGTREVTLYHVFVDNDITELKGQWTNENDKKGIYFNPTYFKTFCYKRSHIYNYDKNHVITSESESDEWSLSSINSIAQGYAIYTNIPIVMNDAAGTVLPPNKAVPLEKIKNVQLIDDSGAKSIKLDNYSSYSKTFTVPDWYDIDLRNPAWEYENGAYCDKFGGDFKMDKIFPSDELLNNALSLKDGGRDKYKCVATIVHNSSHSRGVYNRQMSLEHFFVKTDDFKDNDIVLKGYWDDSTKKSFRIANITYGCYLCGNSIERNRDNDGGWKSSSVNIGVGSGSAIYTNVPIIMNDGTIIEPYFMYGDINDDGVVDIEDTVMLRAYLDGKIIITGRAYKAADANRDGVVDEKDITDSEDHINGKKPINDSNIITNDNDSDSDGLTDLEEYELKTNRFNPDTDGDGLTDKEEKDKGTKPLNPDTDGDYLNDKIDPDPLAFEPIQIDDFLLDDNFVKYDPFVDYTASYVTDGKLDNMSIGEGHKSKNYYKFTRKINKKTEFVIEPLKNSDYEITINNATKNNVLFKIESGNNLTVPIPYSVEDNGNGGISYRFSLIKDFKYNISINNCNTSYDIFEVKISQDNWVYAPNGGMRLSTNLFEKSGIQSDYVEVYFPNKYLIDLLNTKASDPQWDNLNISSNKVAFVGEFTNFFFDDEKTLGIKQNNVVKVLNGISTGATYLGVLPGGQYWGIIIGGLGATTTTLAIIFDNDDCEQFKTDLNKAFNGCVTNNNGEINLCYIHYKEENYDDTGFRVVNTFKSWDGAEYLNKYSGDRRFEVINYLDTNHDFFDLADQ